MNKIPMTAEGFERLEEELKQLKSIERPANLIVENAPPYIDPALSPLFARPSRRRA